jgi:hypothetical protein
MRRPAPTGSSRSGSFKSGILVVRHFLEKARKSRPAWLVLSFRKIMHDARPHELQSLRDRLSFSPSAMNDFSRMEESDAANIAEKFVSASSDEITAQGGRSLSR